MRPKRVVGGDSSHVLITSFLRTFTIMCGRLGMLSKLLRSLGPRGNELDQDLFANRGSKNREQNRDSQTCIFAHYLLNQVTTKHLGRLEGQKRAFTSATSASAGSSPDGIGQPTERHTWVPNCRRFYQTGARGCFTSQATGRTQTGCGRAGRRHPTPRRPPRIRRRRPPPRTGARRTPS